MHLLLGHAGSKEEFSSKEKKEEDEEEEEEESLFKANALRSNLNEIEKAAIATAGTRQVVTGPLPLVP